MDLTAYGAAKAYADKKISDANNNLVWQHPRGDSELVGDGTYNQPILGFYEQMSAITTFNRIELPAWCVTAGANFTARFFIRVSNADFDASAVTPDAEVALTAGQTNHNSGGMQSITLPANLIVPANYYLVVALLASSGNAGVKLWTVVASSGVARHGFFYKTTAGWGTISKTTPPPTLAYGQTSFKLYKDNSTVADGSISEIKLDTATKAKLNDPVPRIILPDEITAVSGDHLQLFVRAMIEAQNPYYKPYSLTCNVGKSYPRYFDYTPVDGDVGTQALTVTIHDEAYNVLATDTVNLKIVKATGQPAASKNILFVGDSLFVDGEVPNEFYRRLCKAGGSPSGLSYGNIAMIGNRNLPSYPAEGKYIGYGGWTWDLYRGVGGTGYWITTTHDKDATDQHAKYQDTNGNQWLLETIEAGKIKVMPYAHSSAIPAAPSTLAWVSGGTHHNAINYTAIEAEASTPFWNSTTDVFSFSAFCTDNGYSGIDAMYIMLGWNGLPTPNKYLAVDHATEMTSVRAFLDQLHTDYPGCVARIMGIQVPSISGGLAANYGANGGYSEYYSMLRTVNGINLAYQSVCDEAAYSSWVRFLSAGTQFDSENNMQQTDTPVNARSATTEKIGTNGVHPANEGYMQLADVAYRDFIRTFCSS